MSNYPMVLIAGRPNAGKSASIRNIDTSTAFINADSKPLPFYYNEEAVNVQNVEDTTEVMDMLQFLRDDNGETYKFVVLDTITDLMRKYERDHVVGAANGLQAWLNYGIYYQDVMDHLKAIQSPVVVMGHMNPINASEGISEARVPIKGANGERGVNFQRPYAEMYK